MESAAKMTNPNNGDADNGNPGGNPSYPNQGPNNQGPYNQYPYNQGGYDQSGGPYNQNPYHQGGYDQPSGGYAQGGYPNYPNAEQANQYGFTAPQGDIGVGVQQPGGELPPTIPVTTGGANLDLGQALSYGFKGFKRGPGAWIGFLVIFGVVVFFVSALGQAFSPGMNEPIAPDASYYSDVSAVFSVITGLVSTVFMIFLVRGAFEIIDGRELGFGDFVKVNNWGTIVLTLLVEWLISVVLAGIFGTAIAVAFVAELYPLAVVLAVVAIVAWIAIMPLYCFLMHIVIDQRVNPIEALKQNIAIAKNNYLALLGLVVMQSLLQLVGMMLCFVGLLYFMPVSLLMAAHGYRQCIGGRRPIV
ncbi:hypothetical protein KRX51_05140 [Corynebacterium sp. TAE3-ERU12]|uniref:hypothetical protein n=1 Tax=Corynebacterium sp. TAE3-ERU12 TaxID=2849491 RepID=UPI001C43D008|nr:hypothetical protein [Corynebacterium sp. TAE3-ERU12]MBV7295305.1 hypothetical protein [Corynebacterium sp. TAE3-ERU12]